MPCLLEKDMWGWHRAQAMYIHPAYYWEVLYALIGVDANFGYSNPFDVTAVTFYLLADANGGPGWPPPWLRIPSIVMRSQRQAYPYVHETPDGELILIEKPAPLDKHPA